MISIPGKIPIRIFPFFWLLAVVIGWINSESVLGTFIWTIVIFLSVLVHEYGHALTANFFGQQANIDLVGLGGVTHRQGKRLKLWKEFIIVLNGPLAGFGLFLLAYLLQSFFVVKPPYTIWKYALIITTYANLFWSILNLLPIHPLDGGKLLNIILEALFGMKGIRAGLFMSCIFAGIAALAFFAMHAVLGGVIFLLLAYESYRAWKGSLYVESFDEDENLQKQMKSIEEDIRYERRDEAIEKLYEIRKVKDSGPVYTLASEYLATLLNNKGETTEAYEVLKPLKSELSPEALHLLHKLAYRNKNWQEAVKIGQISYQAFPSYDTALINALSYAALQEVQSSIGWLQRAIKDGLPNLANALKREEFDFIRQNHQFQKFIQSIES